MYVYIHIVFKKKSFDCIMKIEKFHWNVNFILLSSFILSGFIYVEISFEMSPITKITLAKAQNHPIFFSLFFYATHSQAYSIITQRQFHSMKIPFISFWELYNAYSLLQIYLYASHYYYFCFRFVNALVNARLLHSKTAIEYSLKATKIIYLSNRPFKLKSWSEILQKKNIENSKVS